MAGRKEGSAERKERKRQPPDIRKAQDITQAPDGRTIRNRTVYYRTKQEKTGADSRQSMHLNR